MTSCEGNLGLSSFVLASPFSDQALRHLPHVRAMGYNAVEVCMEEPSLLTPSHVARAAEAEGLSVLVCGAFGADRDLSAESAQQRRKGLDYLKQCSEFASAVGSPVVSGPMYAPTGQCRLLTPQLRAAQWARACDSLASAATFAASAGVKLAIEPINRFETDLVNTVEQGLKLCRDIGAGNVGLLLDTFHMNIEEKSLPEAIRSAGDRLFHFHASENDRGTPGSGHVDWPAVFMALTEVNYHAPVVVESFLPTVEAIARAVSLWRPVAPSMEALASDAAIYLRRVAEHEAIAH